MIMVLSMLLSMACINVEACEEIIKPGDAAIVGGVSLEDTETTLTYNGAPITLTDWKTYTGPQTINVGKMLADNYVKVRFYVQITGGTEGAQIRVFRQYFDQTPNSAADNWLIQARQDVNIVPGGEAAYVEMDLQFKTGDSNLRDNRSDKTEPATANNFWFQFTKPDASWGGNAVVTIAGFEFIKYEQTPPTMSIGETDVTTNSSSQAVSTAEIKFTQKMDTATVLPAEFTLTAQDGSTVANVTDVRFTDASNKTAVLTFDSLVPFDTEYSLTVSENVKNDCDDCEFAVAEESRTKAITFKQPTAIVVGEGRFYSGTTVIDSLVSGRVSYKIDVRNKLDDTPGGREFTLVLMKYENGKLTGIDYDTCTLNLGESDELTTDFRVGTPATTTLSAFLLDNPFDMNAFADMSTISSAVSE